MNLQQRREDNDWYTAHSFSHCLKMSSGGLCGFTRWQKICDERVFLRPDQSFQADGRWCDAKASFLAQEPSEGQAVE